MRLISAGSEPVELERAAPHRLRAQSRDQEKSARLDELVGIRGDAAFGIEAEVEACVELGKVGLEAEPGCLGRGRLDSELDHTRGEKTLDNAHCLDEPIALVLIERLEERRGELVAPAIEGGPLSPSCRGQAHDANAAVRGARLYRNKTFAFESSQ